MTGQGITFHQLSRTGALSHP